MGNERRCTIGKVRFSYLHVFEPSKGLDAGKYSASLIIPKTNKKSLDLIASAIKAAQAEGVAKIGTKGACRLPLRDGDVDRPGDEAYAGSYFLNAKSNKQPGLVDKTKMPIFDQNDLKSGDWGYACISFYAYNSNGSKGIACALEHLMKTDDGEALGGGISTDEAFADVEVAPAVGGVGEFDPFNEDGMPNLN